MKACAYCDEPQVILTIGGLCLGCEADSELRVAKLEELLEKGHALRHYESMAVEAAAASVPARLGRTDDTGQRSREAAPVVVIAVGAGP